MTIKEISIGLQALRLNRENILSPLEKKSIDEAVSYFEAMIESNENFLKQFKKDHPANDSTV